MQVSKWGNSLAVRLPADLVRELGLEEGDQIDLVKDDGQVRVLVPMRCRRLCAASGAGCLPRSTSALPTRMSAEFADTLFSASSMTDRRPIAPSPSRAKGPASARKF